jgi:acyl-CoA synthetase (AMP-forming)/AMP-acid ligase II
MAAFTLALAAWQTQGEIAFVREATADAVLDAVQQRKGNRLYCIPAVWNRILESDLDAIDTSHLRYIDTGTSATPVDLLERLRARFPNASLRIYYGSTETGAGTALLDSEVLERPGSVGRPAPGVDLRLSEEGEICLRTQYLLDGYYNNPEATSQALRDGWYHTGDIGSIDPDGYLSVIGRMKEIIRTGGEGVAPVEVEAALKDHPAVDEIAVVGIPDARWGEVICAVVVAKPDTTVTLDDLQAYCAASLAGFKKPRRLELVDALPKTAATGQIQRSLVVEQIVIRPTSDGPS